MNARPDNTQGKRVRTSRKKDLDASVDALSIKPALRRQQYRSGDVRRRGAALDRRGVAGLLNPCAARVDPMVALRQE
jgi:hypothetical protein